VPGSATVDPRGSSMNHDVTRLAARLFRIVGVLALRAEDQAAAVSEKEVILRYLP
jgi:hypothetical protein